MANQKKVDIVSTIEERFNASQGVYFTRYTGLSVPEITKFRKMCFEESVSFSVTKNTLTKIAAKNAGLGDKFDDLLVGQVGIAYSEDPVAPARVIKGFLNEYKDSLEITGVYFDGELYGADKYKQLASLPSKEELLTKLVCGFNSPMSKLVSTLNGSMSKLVFTLRAIKK
ncbi:MAG: 50S ribosomal protein L10 [Candidatus Marinimicrobia bacterium]|nr:50S ribosomal protein L10 [Candidatus Neomarinimicrobiota bacterium]|tara:strand:+ start:7 stop:516 length:510 start_codon:yes stop_codon:yes gene_type:complete